MLESLAAPARTPKSSSEIERQSQSACDQHRNFANVHQPVRDAPQEDPRHRPLAAAAHHYQVCQLLRGEVRDALRDGPADRARLRANAVRLGSLLGLTEDRL